MKLICHLGQVLRRPLDQAHKKANPKLKTDPSAQSTARAAGSNRSRLPPTQSANTSGKPAASRELARPMERGQLAKSQTSLRATDHLTKTRRDIPLTRLQVGSRPAQCT